MVYKKYKLKDLVDSFSVRARDYGGSKGLEFLGVSNEDGIVKSKSAAEHKGEEYKIIEKGCFAYNPYRINIGSIAFHDEDIKGLISPAYVIFKTKPNSIKDNLLFKFLKSSEGLRQINFYARGTVRKALRFDDLCKIEISIPSFEEQEDLISNIENTEIDSNNVSSELSHQLDLIKQLRQAFLREAMQGKLLCHSELVSETQETGQQLLEKIKAEKAKLIADKKIKKEKTLPPITDDEIPFEIPKYWAWCRLGEIIYNTEGGKSPNCLHEPAKENEWGVIKTTAVQEMVFLQNENKVLPNNFTVYEQHKIFEGDVLITRAGPKNRVGIVCCVENLITNLILSDKTIRINFSKSLIQSKFLALSLNSPMIKPFIERKMTGMADSQVNISQDNMKGFPIPLPPFHEQEQIVAKLEELMAFCDGLEQSIKESQGYNEKLLQQVLREALQASVEA